MIYVFHVLICEIASGTLNMLSGMDEHFAVVVSILSRLLIVSLAVVAIGFVVRILRDKSYSIRQVNVPASFLTMGHSGPVIANRIFFRIQRIIERVNATEHAKG